MPLYTHVVDIDSKVQGQDFKSWKYYVQCYLIQSNIIQTIFKLVLMISLWNKTFTFYPNNSILVCV